MTGNIGKRLHDYAGNYVVFDLETTGLSPAKDEIIEISGIKVQNGAVEEEFSTLVNPNMPIPWAA
ncbi:MAG: DNA polymerase III subunit epsilon, partial [Lachnospiraceae bacterium]|nr:DNA polymerase III subunit epsilon [Lachnospiraceae bacterium]